MADPDMITWHVRLRWLERVRGCDVAGFRADLAAIDEAPVQDVSDYELVPWICAYYEILVEDLDREIAPPLIRSAICAGAQSVKVNGGRHRLVVRNGRIRSVVPTSKTNAPACRKNRRKRGRLVSGHDTAGGDE